MLTTRTVDCFIKKTPPHLVGGQNKNKNYEQTLTLKKLIRFKTITMPKT